MVYSAVWTSSEFRASVRKKDFCRGLQTLSFVGIETVVYNSLLTSLMGTLQDIHGCTYRITGSQSRRAASRTSLLFATSDVPAVTVFAHSTVGAFLSFYADPTRADDRSPARVNVVSDVMRLHHLLAALSDESPTLAHADSWSKVVGTWSGFCKVHSRDRKYDKSRIVGFCNLLASAADDVRQTLAQQVEAHHTKFFTELVSAGLSPPERRSESRSVSPQLQSPEGVPAIPPGDRRPADQAPTQPASVDGAATPRHGMTFLLQGNFTGRRLEREFLTRWAKGNDTALLVLVGIGGMGKSTLAWYWCRSDAHVSSHEGTLWWSFYDPAASFSQFLEAALRAIGEPNATEEYVSDADRVSRLLDCLAVKPWLIILDGFERLLQGDAPQPKRRRERPKSTSAESRACADPLVASLLRSLVALPPRSHVLLTTRLMPSDLEDEDGNVLAGCSRFNLAPWSPEDALVFMRSQGVTTGGSAEIIAVCGEYGFHPLSLRILSALVARDRSQPGDISAAPRHDVYKKIQARRTRVLHTAFSTLRPPERLLLARISALRAPTSYMILDALRDEMSDAQFDEALGMLIESELLLTDAAGPHYDLHPLVRRFAYSRLKDKSATHRLLAAAFWSKAPPEPASASTVDALTPVIEAFYHTARSGQYDDAAKILFSALVPYPLYYRFGALRLCRNLLLELFEGHDEAKAVLAPSAYYQSHAPFSQAMIHIAMGAPKPAKRLLERVLSRVAPGDVREELRALRALATCAMELGDLAAAESHLQRRIELCEGQQTAEFEFRAAVAKRRLGHVWCLQGRQDDGIALLQVTVRYFQRCPRVAAPHEIDNTPERNEARAWLELAEVLIDDDDPAAALLAVERARALIAVQSTLPADDVRLAWLAGECRSRLGDFNGSRGDLDAALALCRKLELHELEPAVLLSVARVKARAEELVDVGSTEAAAAPALVLAKRSGLALRAAECHLFIAERAFDLRDYESAIRHCGSAADYVPCAEGTPSAMRSRLHGCRSAVHLLRHWPHPMDGGGFEDVALAQIVADSRMWLVAGDIVRTLERARSPAVLEQALLFAAHCHAGQYYLARQGRLPYVVHPIAVAGVVRDLLDEAADVPFVVALWHHILEDCDVSEGFVLDTARLIHSSESVSGRVVEALRVLVRPRSYDGAAYYRSLQEGLPEARLVKAADLIANVSTLRRYHADIHWYGRRDLRPLDHLIAKYATEVAQFVLGSPAFEALAEYAAVEERLVRELDALLGYVATEFPGQLQELERVGKARYGASVRAAFDVIRGVAARKFHMRSPA